MKLGRNDPCHCGSGKKYKHCCLGKDAEAQRSDYQIRQELSRSLFEENRRESWYDDWSYEEPEPELYSETEDDWDDDSFDGAKDWDEEDEELDEEVNSVDEGADDEAAEKIWTAFNAQEVEGKIALFEKRLETPDAIMPWQASEMLNLIFEDAVEAEARERYDALIEKVRQVAPNIYAFDALSHVTNRITNALVLAREENLAELVKEHAAFAAEDPMLFATTLLQLRYYGRIDLLRAALEEAWPLFNNASELEDWVQERFAPLAVSAAVFEHLERQDGDDDALFQTLAQFSKIPRVRVEKFIALLNGQQQRTWRASDFEIKKNDRPPRYEDRMEEPPAIRTTVGQNIFNLVLQFQGHLRREYQTPYLKSDVGSNELGRYIIQRALGHLLPPAIAFSKPGELAAQHRQYHLDWPRHVRLLCPDRATMKLYLAELLLEDDELQYRVAALFVLLPSWMDFLVAQQLLEPARRDQTLLELFELHEDLFGSLRRYAHDPHPAKSLIGWPWRQSHPRQA